MRQEFFDGVHTFLCFFLGFGVIWKMRMFATFGWLRVKPLQKLRARKPGDLAANALGLSRAVLNSNASCQV